MRQASFLVVWLGILALVNGWRDAQADEEEAVPEKIRVGIIGCDTSHVGAFTKYLNDPATDNGDLAGIDVVAAFPGGSNDIPASADRVEQFTADLEGMGVEIVGSIEELLEKVDAVMLESVDGRPHLEQAKPVFAAGKRLFIDKPAAGSLADAVEIFRLSRQSGVPCFSSSSLRFSPGILQMRSDERVGKVLGCTAWSPCPIEPHHPDLFWYGIHGVETLYTIMGPGCVSVTRTSTPETDVVTGVWADGRVGTFRGLRSGAQGYGAMVFGEKGIAPSGGYGGYEPLVVEIGKFFRTGVVPVAAEETIEIMAFMEAADESKRQNGARVALESVMARASGQAGSAQNEPGPHEEHARAIAKYSGLIEQNPDKADLYDLRGSAYFKLGKIAESIADFDKAIELEPQREREHWKRGIAYYYAGRYEEGRKQFEGYQTFDSNDVENAVWRYLCMARSEGVAAARAALLEIGNDGRVPMMQVHALFAGSCQPADVLAAAQAGEPSSEELNARLFYAHLYLGLYFEAAGEDERAREHLTKAVEEHAIEHYMCDVARVHLKRG